MGQLFHRLLTEELGYRAYGIQASDSGAEVQLQMALEHPEAIIGLHLSGSWVPYILDCLIAGGRAYLDAAELWEEAEARMRTSSERSPRPSPTGSRTRRSA